MEPHVSETPIVSRSYWPIILGSLVIIALLFIGFLLINRHTRNLARGLVTDPAVNLESSDGLTNVLFLGLGGEGHESPDLTDSIMLVSLKHEDNSVALISVPRDIWVDTLKAKINTAYHYGNEKRDGGGRDLSKSAVGEVLGLPVHYVLALDFDGFIKAIDAVGGIEVNVERTFDDYQYPIPGRETAEPESERYEHLHFDAGPTHMDGKTALKFARSRHAEGEEGTDFARSLRQQKIILAFKDKLLETKTFLSKDTMQEVLGSFQASIDTDIKEEDYGSFLKFFLSFESSGQSLRSIHLEDLLQNPRSAAPYGGQWVLIPAVSWQAIHDYVHSSLN